MPRPGPAYGRPGRYRTARVAETLFIFGGRRCGGRRCRPTRPWRVPEDSGVRPGLFTRFAPGAGQDGQLPPIKTTGVSETPPTPLGSEGGRPAWVLAAGRRGQLVLRLEEGLADIVEGLLQPGAYRVCHAGRRLDAFLELPPGVSPPVAELFHLRGRLVAGFHGTEVHLDLQVLDAPLPLVELGLSQLPAQVGLLVVEFVDLVF